jgi:hypothetical protein
MADPTLSSALSGLQFAPVETGWGIGAQGVAQALPLMQNPYANPLQNLGVTLGGALVASLLGYQSRKEAFDLGLQSQNYANQMMVMQTPAERTAFLETLPSDAINSGIGGRLSTLSTALGQQEALQKALIGQEVAKKQALAEFELGDVGTKVFERQQKADLDKALALASINRPKTTEPGLPAGVQERIVDASTFTDSARAHREKIAAMSPGELKTLLTTGTSMFGLVGDPGFVSENEAVLQLYRKANFGATLTGQEKKAADIISGKNLTASKADILAALDTLIDQSQRRAKKTVEVASKSRSEIASMLEGTGTEPIGETPAEKKNRELKERLAKLEALAAQRK